MKIRPIGQQVLIKFIEKDNKTATGIILTNEVKGKPEFAEILELGDLIDKTIKKGQVAVVSRYAGTEFKLNGEKVHIILEKDVLAIVEDKNE
jgi:chaperonin GroES